MRNLLVKKSDVVACINRDHDGQATFDNMRSLVQSMNNLSHDVLHGRGDVDYLIRYMSMMIEELKAERRKLRVFL